MLLPGANVSQIARQLGVSRQHLYLWRKAALCGELPLYPPKKGAVGSPISVVSSPASPMPLAIEVEVAGFLVRAPEGSDIDLLTQIVGTLKGLA
jgi:transposase-like protein